MKIELTIDKLKALMSLFPELKSLSALNIVEEDYFIDERDGKRYKTVKIGNQVWMAENLAYKPSTGKYWAYDNDPSNVTQHGYLYDWETAKNVCPKGWHLPTKEEFEELLANYGGRGKKASMALKQAGESGFYALLGGWRHSTGDFYDGGSNGLWWSSSENGAYSWNLYVGGGAHMHDGFDRSWGFSVRCIKD